ncbi:MAG: hypothetical protein KY468_01830 [Armatimonadetes bacterium]|nr:hypothetical protein [Armatimonadota bacterium]
MSKLIRQYRKVHLDLRKLYDPFTEEHCPTCPTPCCMKPARVDSVDIALAEAHGCTLPPHADPEEDRNETAKEYLGGGVPIYFRENVPCDFLGETGCAFPRDLRPYGCTRFICDPMKRLMDPAKLREVKVLLKRLDYLHEQIVAVANGKRRPR